MASTDVWGNVVSQVAGERAGRNVTITSIITNPDTDPHSYEASSRNQLALSQANLVVKNGGGYDDVVHTMLASSDNTSAVVLNAVKLSGKRAHDGELNEHVWYDFPTVQKVADQVAAALSRADPGHRTTYQQNAKACVSKLRVLEGVES
nr:zinc ABC transporter substrate-binding protein [Leekyejoonella antrihumi]